MIPMTNTNAWVTANCINTPTTTIVCALALLGARRLSISSKQNKNIKLLYCTFTHYSHS